MKQKKRKGKPIPYDYEAAFPDALEQESIDDVLERDRRHRGDVYATKEVRAGDQLEVEIYPEFGRDQKNLIPPELSEKQKRAQKKLNDTNSAKRCERTINENFSDRDIWATFTYSSGCVPESEEEAERNIKNYVRRLNYKRKKMGLPNARYVYTIEHGESGRWHHHFVTDGDIDMDTIESLWNLGRRNQVRRLSKDENGLTGMGYYLAKEPKSKKGSKKWVASKGLKKPDERVNHYKFKRKDVREMVRDANMVKPLMEKWYGPEGYIFTSAKVRYNDFNGRFYIYARMRKQVKPPSSGRRKGGRNANRTDRR